jgi:ABC-type lipoprotein export system ATPase subunit
MSAPIEPAIRAVGLSKVYRSGDANLVVFAGLNLEVAEGEKLALVGESGSGKSTLLHLLGGLDRPTEGAIYFGQNDICQLPANQLAEFRNRELGFVWQIHGARERDDAPADTRPKPAAGGTRIEGAFG